MYYHAAPSLDPSMNLTVSPNARAETERLYVDSRALAHVLRQRFDTEAHAPPPPHSTDPGSLEAAAERRARRRAGAAASPKRYREGADGHFHHEVCAGGCTLRDVCKVDVDGVSRRRVDILMYRCTCSKRAEPHPSTHLSSTIT